VRQKIRTGCEVVFNFSPYRGMSPRHERPPFSQVTAVGPSRRPSADVCGVYNPILDPFGGLIKANQGEVHWQTQRKSNPLIAGQHRLPNPLCSRIVFPMVPRWCQAWST